MAHLPAYWNQMCVHRFVVLVPAGFVLHSRSNSVLLQESLPRAAAAFLHTCSFLVSVFLYAL